MDETTGMTQDDARYSWVFKNTIQDLDFIVLISKSVRALSLLLCCFFNVHFFTTHQDWSSVPAKPVSTVKALLGFEYII